MRLEKVKKIVKSMNGEEYTRIIAAIEIETGVSPKTAKNYIKTLRDYNFLETGDGCIYVKSVSHPDPVSLDKKNK